MKKKLISAILAFVFALPLLSVGGLTVVNGSGDSSVGDRSIEGHVARTFPAIPGGTATGYAAPDGGAELKFDLDLEQKSRLYEVKIGGEEYYDSAYAVLVSLNSYRKEKDCKP